jgi:RNA 2',3'-cyclic 3'-phosphodiesterase
VTSAASVGGSERLRLFLAYELPVQTAEALAGWAAEHLRGRLVRREDLHVTLAFLGSRPASDLAPVLDVLERAAADAAPPRFELVRWRETRSAGMLVLRDETGAAAPFAGRLHRDLASLGLYRPENRDWLPHVTVLRYRERPRLSPPLPGVAPFAPSGAAAFLSRLHPSGSRYEVLGSFRLSQ